MKLLRTGIFVKCKCLRTRHRNIHGVTASHLLSLVKEIGSSIWLDPVSCTRIFPRDFTNSRDLTISQKFDMDVSSQPDVVSKIPAVVVGILVDHDLIRAPVPSIAEGEVNGSDCEVETAEPKALSIATGNTPNVALTESAVEVAVLPGMIEVIVRIIGAGIVADPFIVGVDVRGVGMAIFVDVFWWCRMLHRFGWSRAMRRNVASADALNGRRRRRMFFLRESGNRTDQKQCKNS
jgi:hypothetical protein